jgi:DNA-binding NtrC family response regulator
MPLDELLTQLERRLIEQALQRARQNKSRAAELLDISRPRLYRRIKELNIPDVPEPADDAPRTPTVDAAP